MIRSIDDFVGTFTIRHGDGNLSNLDSTPLIQAGYWLCVGTGNHGDVPSDGVKVGVAIVDPDTGQRVLPAEGSPSAFAYISDGTLNGSSYWLDGSSIGLPNRPLLLAYQISLMTSTTEDGGQYNALTILVSIGDPENAGVWAADDQSDG